MSEVTIATRSRDSAQPVTMQISFELRIYLNLNPIEITVEYKNNGESLCG